MKKNRVVVDMNQYGIETVVVANFDELESIRHRFNTSPDNTFFNGEGKAAMYEWLLGSVRDEDTYFNKHLELVSSSNERWLNFLADCLILAVLCTCLHGTPIQLIHPDGFEEMKSRFMVSSFSFDTSDFMRQIPSVA